jgi:hypothetical protein
MSIRIRLLVSFLRSTITALMVRLLTFVYAIMEREFLIHIETILDSILLMSRKP